MRFGNYRYRLLLASLLLAGMIPSCKSPMAPQGGPTLTLILPDSARAFDIVVFRAHFSDSIKSSWKFEWQFGDSSSGASADTSITHVYDSAGTYSVLVTLVDNAGKTIAKQSSKINILPLNAPTLTLIVSDTVFWGDSCVMSVASSQPLAPSWRYKWTFGDTTSFSSRADSIVHWYLNPGNYTVAITLEDTVRQIPISSKTAVVNVIARHFDLAMLQSMKYVDVIWSADSNTVNSGTQSICGEPMLAIPTQIISWNGLGFGTFDEGGSARWDSTHSNLLDSDSYETSDSGSLDLSLTCLTNFSESFSSFRFYQGPPSFCRLTDGYSFSTRNVPFKATSDSDIVFEGKGPQCNGSAFSAFVNSNSLWGSGSYSAQETADFSKLSASPYVIIRFHK